MGKQSKFRGMFSRNKQKQKKNKNTNKKQVGLICLT